jgi:hypothetical protein
MHNKSGVHNSIAMISLQTLHSFGIRTQVFCTEADSMSTAPRRYQRNIVNFLTSTFIRDKVAKEWRKNHVHRCA